MDTTNATPGGDDGSAHATISDYERDTFISWQVLKSLGSPVGLHQVKVRPVGIDHYRVNVLVKNLPDLPRIANSFFLTTDSASNILDSSPKIVRIY